MNRATISIARAYDYNEAEVYSAVKKSIDLIGGLEKVVKPGSKVFVKINYLSPPSEAERGIVTHPIFVKAVLELLKETNAEITVGDDIDSVDGDGFQISGLRQICDRAGIRLVNLRETGFVKTGCEGHFLKNVYLSSTVLDADIIINLPKLKTHALTVFTGGIKNMFGTIPQGFRKKFHGEYTKVEDFSQVLTDIFSTAMPKLTIMDGIVAMEEEGPSSGKLRNIGVVLAGYDTVALDTVAAKIINVEPLDIYTTRYAAERGLGVGNIANIEVVGEKLEDVIVPDFKLPKSSSLRVMERMPGFLFKFVQAKITVRPEVIEKQCTLCLACQKMCPVAATTEGDKAMKIDHHICIKCLCCYEACRFEAIKLDRPATGRAIYWLNNFLKKLKSLFN